MIPLSGDLSKAKGIVNEKIDSNERRRRYDEYKRDRQSK